MNLPADHDTAIALSTPRRSVETWIAVLATAVLCVITLANVLTRYFSDQSFALTEEVSVFLMLLLTLAGACSATARDQHIRIEFFYESGDAQRRRRLQLFSALVTALFFFGFGLLFCRIVFDEIKFSETSQGLGIPRWWYTIWVPVFCGVITWRALQLAKSVSVRVAGRSAAAS